MVFFFDTTAKKINTFVYLVVPLTFLIYCYMSIRRSASQPDGAGIVVSSIFILGALTIVIPSIISYIINTISFIIIDRYIKDYIINTILKMIIFILVFPTVMFVGGALIQPKGV